MPEPISTGGSAAAVIKIYGLASVTIASIVLVCLVVLLMHPPRSPQEWAVGLICTVVSSVGLGAAAVEHFSLQGLAQDYVGMCALGLLVFICGLPGWFMVRLAFNYMNRNESASLVDVIRDVRKAMKGDE